MIEPSSSSPFRKSMNQLRCSGSKSQRDGTAAVNQCINFFAGGNSSLNHSNNQNNSFIETLPTPSQNLLPVHIQQQQMQQQPSLRSARNNSENKINYVASTAANNINNFPANARTNLMIRSHSNFSATPSKKKEQENQPMVMMMCPSGYPPSSKPTGNPSGVPKSSQSSVAGSSAKPITNSSIFSNSFMKENIGTSMHKHSASSALVGLNNSSNISKNTIPTKGQFGQLSPNYPLPSSSQTGYLNQSAQPQPSDNNNNGSSSLSPNAKNFYHNILNSSWKVNMAQPSQTPKKTGENCSSSATKPSIQTNTSRGYLKTHSHRNPTQILQNLTDKSTSHVQQQQTHSPLHASSPTSVSAHNNSNHQSQFNNNSNNANNNPNNNTSSGRLNTSASSSSRTNQTEETKRLKLELEQFKNREIKYLVRIATLEKEAKKLSEQLDKSESSNREISAENVKIRRINSFSQSQVNHNNTSSGFQVSSNYTQSIDELQRSMRQKTDPLDLCCSQCGISSQFQKLQTGSSGSSQSSNSQNFGSYNKYKLKYAQLRQQHKDILRQCIEKETENAELRTETQLVRQILMNSTSNVQISSTEISSKQTFSQGQQGSQMPSFLKALSLGNQQIGSSTIV